MGEQMLKLGGRVKALRISNHQQSLLTITTNPSLPSAIRDRYALLCSEPVASAAGFGAVLLRAPADVAVGNDDVYLLPEDFSYLQDGDIVSIDPIRQNLQALFRK